MAGVIQRDGRRRFVQEFLQPPGDDGELADEENTDRRQGVVLHGVICLKWLALRYRCHHSSRWRAGSYCEKIHGRRHFDLPFPRYHPDPAPTVASGRGGGFGIL